MPYSYTKRAHNAWNKAMYASEIPTENSTTALGAGDAVGVPDRKW